MIADPTIAEERLARDLALWHGQTPLYRDPGTRVMVTVANLHKAWNDRTGFSWETERYVDRHWREYLAAARAIIQFRQDY